jgi:hypothetical protein
MHRTTEAVYLGANITRKIDPKVEIKRRISMTMPTLKKLDILWNQTKCCDAWKIQVFNAVITSKLIYGLETIEPTEGAAKMFNTLQLKGFRKILKISTTHIDRANTNEVVYQKAQDILRSKNTTKPPCNRKPEAWLERQVRPITTILEEKKLDLLGHVLRRDFLHPAQQVTFDTAADTAYGRPLVIKETCSRKRQGRPRLHWTYENMARAWNLIRKEDGAVPENLKNEPFSNQNGEINSIIASRAANYSNPFEGSKARRKAMLGR